MVRSAGQVLLKVTRKSEPCRVQAQRVLGKKFPAVIFLPKKRRFSPSELGKGLGLSRRSRTMTHNTDKDGKAVFRPLPEKIPGLSRYYHAPTKSLFPVFILPKKAGTKAARLTLLHNTVSFACGRPAPCVPFAPLCRVRCSFFVPFRLFLHCGSPSAV